MYYAISMEEGTGYMRRLENEGIRMFSVHAQFATFWLDKVRAEEYGDSSVTVELDEEPYASNPEIMKALVSGNVNACIMLAQTIWDAWKDEWHEE